MAKLDFPFKNSYARLPERFFSRLPPTPVPLPGLVKINEELAQKLGFDCKKLGSNEGIEFLAGNYIPDSAEPIAMAYAGHQFGGWVPQLGDGRAILLGEIIDPDGRRRDIQLKGAGRTPFSRSGDGRAVLGPILREYIVSEAMAKLGIPSTRTLAVLTTGERIQRERLLPGAILTRVAQSHIRVGTFQFFYARQDFEALNILANHVIERHFPKLSGLDKPYKRLLDCVIERQAELIAHWQMVGFIHGVMNTDNTSICGETIDYGPCAFMDAYHPNTVFSSIDQMGRYAYARQPEIAKWNLLCFAETLIPLFSEPAKSVIPALKESLHNFDNVFKNNYLFGMRKKLGFSNERTEDARLIEELLDKMAKNKADYTLTFRKLSELKFDDCTNDYNVGNLFSVPSDFDEWAVKWRNRLYEDPISDFERKLMMDRINPVYIARNHRVEQAISAAVNNEDFTPFHTLNSLLAKPFEFNKQYMEFADAPSDDQLVYETFCGT